MDQVFKALADPTRRGILKLLRERDLSAGEIAASFNLAKPTLSGHFAVLRAADLVSTERQGTSLIYRLNCSVLEEALMGFVDFFSLGTVPLSVTTSCSVSTLTASALTAGLSAKRDFTLVVIAVSSSA